MRKFNQANSGTDVSQNPYPKKLKAQQNNGNRKPSIMLNSVKEEKAENSERTSSQKTKTDESKSFTNTFEASNNFEVSNDDNTTQSNPRLPKISYRASTTRRKSCFLTEMNHHILLQKQTSQAQDFHANKSQGSNIKIDYQRSSKNSSGSDLPS